ncbi:hypothetical protein N1851_003759 [Merluccius polli]|uniref:Uncharacterized protein n=1 Tax=Merluccius polli TaxID=89951 RepID=A0AA47N913_MERPO|nr:hypothetical protein N1851_003759 [Merluccius polli]
MFEICDFKMNNILLDNTVGQMYEQTKLKLLRFYICTKEGASTDHSSSEENELLEDEENEDGDGSHSDDSITDLQDRSHSSDSDGSTQVYGTRTDMQPRSKKRRATSETETAHPQSRSITSLSVNPNRHKLQLLLPSGEGLPTLDEQQSIHEEAVQTAQQDSGPNLPSDSSSQLSSSTSASNPGNPETFQRASICRIKVVADLVAVFMDSSIMNMTLKMDFVNERAVDDAGVSREVYTAFWEQFLEQCEGETERVPRLRPDFSEAEWQAVGRIWVKGFVDHGVMPVKLSIAFILACINGIDC